VKLAAENLGLPVYLPESLRSAESRAPLADALADIFVVAAYGQIFGAKTLAIPRSGCVNLHASILPAYRGASPVNAAILSGDRETGVTLMRMDAGLGTGPIVSIVRSAIEPDDTTETLTARLAALAASIAPDAIAEWISGSVPEIPQPESGASLVRPLIKADGWIKWNQSAEQVSRTVQAMQPWPRAWTTTPSGAVLQVLKGDVVDSQLEAPGIVRAVDGQVLVGCGNSAYRLGEVQVAGGTPGSAVSLFHGRRLLDGCRLGSFGEPDPPPPLVTPLSD